ncbi:YciC family protein [Ewingella sp. S1.OA.A_B6]
MPITASTLYRDSFNFMRNQLTSILLLALLTAFITVILNQLFIPGADQLSLLSATSDDLSGTTGMSLQELIQNMSPEQQMVLLKVSAAATFSALVGNVLLVGGMLTLIQMVSNGMTTSALRSIGASAPILPRLLGLMLVCTLLVQLGLTLFIVPGVLIAVAVSMAPVISSTEKMGVFKSIKISSKLAFANARLLFPAIMFWLAAKMLVLLAVSHLTILPAMAATVVLSTLSNLISALLLIYLFRLYSKLRV